MDTFAVAVNSIRSARARASSALSRWGVADYTVLMAQVYHEYSNTQAYLV